MQMRQRGMFSALTIAGADTAHIPIRVSRAGTIARLMPGRRKGRRRGISGRGADGAAAGEAVISVWVECVAAVEDREAGNNARIAGRRRQGSAASAENGAE